MKKVVCFLILLSKTLFAQDLQWLKQVGGYTNGAYDNTGLRTKVDAAGNTFVALQFGQSTVVQGISYSSGFYIFKFDTNGTVALVVTVPAYIDDFDVDGTGAINITGSYTGTANFSGVSVTATNLTTAVYLAKYNSAGVVQWVKSISNDASNSGVYHNNFVHGIVADATGNVYITGSFVGNTDFGGTTLPCVFSFDFFVAKYSSTGNLSWVRHAHSVSNSSSIYAIRGNAITLDNSGNVIITGLLTGVVELVIGGIDIGEYNNSDGKFFIAKYSNGGTFIWEREVSHVNGAPYATDVVGTDIKVDVLDNIYAIGFFRGTTSFSGTILTCNSDFDGFLAKYDGSGLFIWAKQMTATGSNECRGNAIEIDAAGNNVFAIGTFQGTTSFGGIALTSIGIKDSFIAKYDNLGNTVSAKQFGSTAKSNQANGIAIDGSGNTYITGAFQTTVNFSGTSKTAFGNQDAYLTKYNAADVLQYVKHWGGANFKNARGKSIVADAAGNTLVTGEFAGITDFGGITLSPSSTGNDDIFVAKYNVTGNLQWAIQTTGGSYHYVYDISTDAAGNAYITGVYAGTLSFGGTTLTAVTTALEVFLVKFDNTGVLQWAKQISPATSSPYAGGLGLNVDGSGNIFLTGTFNGTVNFGGTNLTSIGTVDMYLAKYNSAGTLQWVRQAGSPTKIDFGSSVAVDASGNAYVTGGFKGATNFSGTILTALGTIDLFVAKYNTSGTLVWVKQVGVAAQEVVGSDICIDGSGNSYVSGDFGGTVNFGGTTLSSIGTADMFIAKFDDLGNTQWVKQAGSAGKFTSGRSNTIDATGNVYITGEFLGTTNFDGTLINLVGLNDVYIAKYDNAGMFSSVKQIGGVGNNTYSYGISTDASANIYTTGSFEKNTNFLGNNYTSIGSSDVFILSLSQNNNLIETITSGNWNATGTWNSNTIPTATKTAKVNVHTVSIPNTGNEVKTIQMNGGVINLNGGTLEIKNQ
ncbi:beta strand repeat-containing protein [Lacihabitans soyangensis]|uniref:Beta-propeller repeat protein n=1 Tax=Lacihabitans soyangensis TaxID=869394 RepID=A0AAE3H5L5_9BACT|nr:SBBP repeat-containing protein [Lacihabitans soyangensis]MCP9764444.1 hypothetical protein [Lacihabitans soyangensis]